MLKYEREEIVTMIGSWDFPIGFPFDFVCFNKLSSVKDAEAIL